MDIKRLIGKFVFHNNYRIGSAYVGDAAVGLRCTVFCTTVGRLNSSSSGRYPGCIVAMCLGCFVSTPLLCLLIYYTVSRSHVIGALGHGHFLLLTLTAASKKHNSYALSLYLSSRHPGPLWPASLLIFKKMPLLSSSSQK